MQHQFQHGILKVNLRQDVQVSKGIHRHALKSTMSKVYAELPIIIIVNYSRRQYAYWLKFIVVCFHYNRS